MRDISGITGHETRFEETPGGTARCVESCYFNRPLLEVDPLALTSHIPEAFERFVCALPADLQLRRAGFVIAHQKKLNPDSSLSVIAIADGDTVSAGLGIAIPRDKSALHEICDSRCLKTIVPAEDFRGNFVERHALLVSPDGCMGLYPLETNRLRLGAATLNCDNCSAFTRATEEIRLAVGELCQRITELVPRFSTDDLTSVRR